MKYSLRQSGCIGRRCRGSKPFFNAAPVQAKLENTPAGDNYEHEANVMAGRVVNGNSKPDFFKPSLVGNSGSSGMYNFHEPLNCGGNNMDAATRNFMEAKFGYDFSNVKIYSDSTANQSARDINALAYTHGNNIVFGAGRYQPDTQSGRELLAHELTHVVQQQGLPSALQRKPRNAKEDKVSEMFDNDIDDFKRNYHLKIIFKGLIDSQKTPVKANKDGDVIGVTLGQTYADEQDENIRKAWMRTEIIGNFVKDDRFEDLAHDPTREKLNELNPPYQAGKYCTLNCPATAQSLAEYLKTGTINKAYCNPLMEGNGKGYGFDISMNTFSKDMTWKQAEAATRKQLTKHGDFVVIEARRSAAQMKQLNISERHYFTVVNVKGTLFAIDASMGGIVSSDLQNFIDQNIVATTYRLAKGEFKVKLVIL